MNSLQPNNDNITKWIDAALLFLCSVATNLLATWIIGNFPPNTFTTEVITIIIIALIILSVIAIATHCIYLAVAQGIALGLVENLIAVWFQQTVLGKAFTVVSVLGLLLLAATSNYLSEYLKEKQPNLARKIQDLFAPSSSLTRYPWYLRIILNPGILRDIIAGLFSFSLILIVISVFSLERIEINGLYILLSPVLMGAISALLSGRKGTACILPALISSIGPCVLVRLDANALPEILYFLIAPIVGAMFFDALPKFV